MATVSPVSFGVHVPKYTPKSSQQQTGTTNPNIPVASKSSYTNDGVVANERGMLGVLITAAMFCTFAIVNLIKAGR